MIGLYGIWQGAAVDPGVADRFTRSLATGLDKVAGQYRGDGVLLAALCPDRARAQRWTRAFTPYGWRVLFDGYLR